MKRIAKIIAGISFACALIGLFFYLYTLLRKHQIRDLVSALLKSQQTETLEDLDGRGVRWIGLDTPENRRQFEAHMARMNYVPLDQFGRTKLYCRHGEEVLVKERRLLNRYIIFEIYNEVFFNVDAVA